MNVLFLTKRFYPEVGGVEKHVYEVSRELARRGNRVAIIAEKSVSNYHSKYQSDTYGINSKGAVKSIQTDNSKAKNITVLRVNVGKDDWLKKIRIWARLFKYTSLMREADVVHCHDVFFWYLPFRFLFPRKKVYTTFHGYETKYPPTLRAKFIRKISERLSVGNICIGRYISKWYGTKPDYISYGGVSEAKGFAPKIQNSYNNKKTMNILLIGRLEEDNGAKIYLEALKKLRNIKISYNLIVCGDGTLKNRLKQYGKVRGFVTDLNKYIDRADFIFASSYLSILEALYRGKKVFSVYQNDLKEDYLRLSPFSKYTYIAQDANSLVKLLLGAVSGDIKSYSGVNYGQNWARSRTWSKVADIYLKIWKS